MPEIIYRCYFDDWSMFMDGDLIIDGTTVPYDFVSEKQAKHEGYTHELNILNPFTEDEARKHLAEKGHNNIKFIYEQEVGGFDSRRLC